MYFRLLKVIWVLVLLQEYCQITTTTTKRIYKRKNVLLLTTTTYIHCNGVCATYVSLMISFLPPPPPSICLPSLADK